MIRNYLNGSWVLIAMMSVVDKARTPAAQRRSSAVEENSTASEGIGNAIATYSSYLHGRTA
jgi:hypothetical protein